MSNATVNDAMTIRGTDPQFLVEKIIRTRIYESMYWKESCFGLTAESLIERAVDLQAIGGQYANQRPTEFLCLTLKLLQLQPSKDIVIEFLKNEDFKYLRALAALYIRLVGTAVEIYEYLEPLFNDFRKLRIRHSSGEFGITYMDDFVDQLLREERVCDIILPRLPKRFILEENDELPPRISILEEELDDQEDEKSSNGDKSGSDSESSDGTSRSRSRRGRRSSRDSRTRNRSTSSRSRSDSDRSYSRRRRSRSRSRGREYSRRHKSRSRSSSSAPRKSGYSSRSNSSH
ncbi:Pre-mRNA-splicing factor 38A [Entomophthora muscae]|uniref:Pre-mRNA-splicing factor 38A n=1 Tax=Entomophthora muscae TaxID=34485 RepID=A0ACC2UR91_9FUNG|nr:Pre-mRNA-splicing factor 38A [Entomophthora muscae]